MLSAEEAAFLAQGILSALEAAHAMGIVHRDVKPDNVFVVSRPGRRSLVKLLDFGMCRRSGPEARDDQTLTRAGHAVGTPEYMAPEQVSGKRAFDARIDLYAVGVILYEALTSVSTCAVSVATWPSSTRSVRPSRRPAPRARRCVTK